MAIGPLADVSSLSPDHLYDLYFAIAEKDHVFRIQSQYGATPPPAGHCEFRPLTRETFTARLRNYDQIAQPVGQALRVRLARQASAYGVNPENCVSQSRVHRVTSDVKRSQAA